MFSFYLSPRFPKYRGGNISSGVHGPHPATSTEEEAVICLHFIPQGNIPQPSCWSLENPYTTAQSLRVCVVGLGSTYLQSLSSSVSLSNLDSQ